MRNKDKLRVLTIFGTRPEAIKMCPLVVELESRNGIDSIVCVTGQHRQMLDQVLEIFGTQVAYDLAIMRPHQSLYSITADVIRAMQSVLEQTAPDVVLVHGDTTTSFTAALAAFYAKVPVGHVEAGLRTHNPYSPFPEEMNRTLTGHIASLHFAPTEANRQNLEREGVVKNVYVTGNTVIDAFGTTIRQGYQYKDKILRGLDLAGKKLILMTAHRRENFGAPLENICRAAASLAQNQPDVELVYPVHLNPIVQETAHAILGSVPRVHLIEPLDVEDMHNLIAASYLVLTDSGGLQEEAPSLGVPVLVMRTETERPEAVQAGTVKVVGVDCREIVQQAEKLLENSAAHEKMAKAVNPYGDGHASEHIADILLSWHREGAEQ